MGYAYGTLMMRKYFLRLAEHFPVFRVNGDKFNILVFRDDVSLACEFLNCKDERYEVYYGIVDSAPITGGNFQEIRKRGVELMYEDKARKKKQTREVVLKEEKIVGDIGNTPPELQETQTHKFLKTMWYSEIYLTIKATAREAKVYVYPTEYKENLASLNTIVVVDDLINPRVYVGKSVNFGLGGLKFTITARFGREGDLNVVCFKDTGNRGEYDIRMESHDGVCIPASFGKRIGNDKEIYPIKHNVYGTTDYVLWDKNNNSVIYNDTGIVQIDDVSYAVHTDVSGIDLIKQS